jgi:hypothetical protein
MAGADAIMMRRHPVSPRPQPRAIVQPARPSPFHHVAPEIEVTQTLSAHAVAARAPVPEPVAERAPVAEPQTESRLGRFLSRIPLLRHLRKHPPSD